MARVLVIDDSRLMAEFAKSILVKNGHEVFTAPDGPSGIEIARAEKPQVILLDVVMPGIDGYAVCSQLKNDEDTKDIAIVMLTSKAEPADKIKGLAMGAVDYVTKPFDAGELIARVNTQVKLQELYNALQERNRQLQDMAIRDGLTTLYNHRYFQEQLATEFTKSIRYGDALTCIIIDIDHFKQFNDTYGHQTGDAILSEMGRLLRHLTRSGDVPARYGGEEFAVLLLRCDRTTGRSCAERLRKAVEEHEFRFQDNTFLVTVSVGAASSPDERISLAKELLEGADKALYAAKRGGRNRAEVF
ncbi:MAG TPA: diguanylate cyclase [Proteobacteria bacterium]|nr:diguanylate cyclase [Pseudomonadota bacterium]